MLKYGIVLVGLFGLGFLCSALAEEEKLKGTLIQLSGPGGKTRGASTGYFFGTEWATWDEAKALCEQSGKTLLAIESKLKQGVFEQYLDASLYNELAGWSGYAWTAGNDRRSTTGPGKARFYWSAAGSEKNTMNFWNFFTGNEDPGTGCVAVSNIDTAASFGKWYVQPCTLKTMYFCESKN